MTIAERLELIRAGYTREEIATFESDPEQHKDPDPEQHNDPDPEQHKDPDPEQHKDPDPEQHKDPDPDNGNAAVLAAIANLTKAIQMSNLKSANVGADNKLTPEQALAQGVFGNKS